MRVTFEGNDAKLFRNSILLELERRRGIAVAVLEQTKPIKMREYREGELAQLRIIHAFLDSIEFV